MVGLLTVGIIIAYVDRINLSSALPEMRKSFPLSPEASGILLSAFFWSYAALQTPAGWIIDRFGVKWPYAIAFSIWSVISAGTALVGTLGGLIGVRILLGIGESVVTPASMRYIRTNFAEKERGLAIGIYMSGTKYGPTIGAPLAAYLVANYGWQVMFLVTGLGCLLWADSVDPSGAERRRSRAARAGITWQEAGIVGRYPLDAGDVGHLPGDVLLHVFRLIAVQISGVPEPRKGQDAQTGKRLSS